MRSRNKSSRSRWLLSVASLALAAALLSACSTVPVTGRSQLNLISTSEEMQLGLNSFEQIKKENKINTDPAINATLQKVGKRIASVAGTDMPNAQWEFVLFDSKEANAFCLPGGKVGVFTGILPVTRDEAGLATVIGHEVAHAVARHGANRMSEAFLLQTGSSLIGIGMSAAEADPRWQAAVVTAYGLGAQLGRELPHSRRQESEADQIGLLYMARAGYDPEAAIGFWQRFADLNQKQGAAGVPAFLRTHPTDETRIRQLREWMPRAKAEYRPSSN